MSTMPRREFLATGGAALAWSAAPVCEAASTATWPLSLAHAVGLALEHFATTPPPEQLVDALAGLRPGHVRWPGGELANYWDWRSGCPRAYPLSPRYTTPGLSFAQLHRLQERGSKVVVIVNMLTDTLESQLQMLTAMRDAGIQIELIELGNEFYLANTGTAVGADYRKVFPDGATYAAMAAVWADRIRSHFPRARCAAVASPGGGRGFDWNVQVGKFHHAVDAFTLHFYAHLADGAGREGIGAGDFEPLAMQGADALTLAQDRFTGISSRFGGQLGHYLSRTLYGVPASKPVWLSEFNKSKYLSVVNGTWLHALICAAGLLMFAASPRIEMVTLYNMTGPSTYASIYRDVNNLDGLAGERPAIAKFAPSPIGLMLAVVCDRLRRASAIISAREQAAGLFIVDLAGDQGNARLCVNTRSEWHRIPGLQSTVFATTFDTGPLRRSFPAGAQIGIARDGRFEIPPFSLTTMAVQR